MLGFRGVISKVRVLLVAFALGVPASAWSAIEFTNAWNGTQPDPNTLQGSFFQSIPFDLDNATVDLVNSTAIWSDGDGDKIFTSYVSDAGTPVNAFLTKFTGTFDITGGTGKFLGTDGQGVFEAFFFYSAPGVVAQVTSINAGEITLIPEPATWLMLLGGLGLLGAARLRRVSRAA
jgi:hypothetical protein